MKVLMGVMWFLIGCCIVLFLFMIYGAVVFTLDGDAVAKFDVSHLEKIDSGKLILDGRTNCLGYEDDKTTSFFVGSTKFSLSHYYYSPCIEEGNAFVDVLKIPADTKLDIYRTSWSPWIYQYCIVPQGYGK